MKDIFKYTIIILSLTFTSCVDVIDVDVPFEGPRLVIEASLDWEKGTLGNNQTIKLSTSTPFFENEEINTVSGAYVRVTKDDDGTTFIFDDQNNGTYITNNFIPEINQSYTLEVIYNNETYVAHEKLTPVVDIINIYQSTDKGLPDVLEVNVDFLDPIDEDNYYFFKVKEQQDFLPTLFDIKDEFVDGNLVNVFIERTEDENINQEEYKPGDIVTINFYGISTRHYNYINLLIQQFNMANNPFGTTPVLLKGNCVNITNTDNYAYGYFRMSQMVKASYTFQ